MGFLVPTIPDTVLPPPVPGQEVDAADWTTLQDNIDAARAQVLLAVCGSANANLPFTPFSITARGGFYLSPLQFVLEDNSDGSYGIVIGGPNNAVFCQGLFLDQCGAQTFRMGYPPNGQTQLDAIYIQAIRHPGPNPVTINRKIRSATVASFVSTMVVQLQNGTATVVFPSTYLSTPQVFAQAITGSSIAAAEAPITVSNRTTTGCVVTSSDPTDARTIELEITGDVVQYDGVATNIELNVSSPTIVVVAGTPVPIGQTPAVSPPPNDGTNYELFATVLNTLQNNLSTVVGTYKFPTIVPPITFTSPAVSVITGP
jgi:hypothetical protein